MCRDTAWKAMFQPLDRCSDSITIASYKCSGLNESIRKTVDSSLNVMAHGEAREGKWRGNWRMERVASTLHTTSEHGVSSITTSNKSWCAHLGCQQSTELTSLPNLNGLVRFAERRSLVSARLPSHLNWPLLQGMQQQTQSEEPGAPLPISIGHHWVARLCHSLALSPCL